MCLLLLGGLLIALTTLIHALFTAGALEAFGRLDVERTATPLARISVLVLLVLLMSFAALLEAALWALTYVGTGVLRDLETALYFSVVTFTTLGYGDVTMPAGWRLLGALEAANGTIMFGWTTALIVAAVRRLYFPPGSMDGS